MLVEAVLVLVVMLAAVADVLVRASYDMDLTVLPCPLCQVVCKEGCFFIFIS